MRRARRVDSNQAAIVEALRDAGRFVEVLSDVGRGVPDLLVGAHGRWVMIEIKATARDKLTPAEAQWHLLALARWLPVVVVTTAAEAIAATAPP